MQRNKANVEFYNCKPTQYTSLLIYNEFIVPPIRTRLMVHQFKTKKWLYAYDLVLALSKCDDNQQAVRRHPAALEVVACRYVTRMYAYTWQPRRSIALHALHKARLLYTMRLVWLSESSESHHRSIVVYNTRQPLPHKLWCAWRGSVAHSGRSLSIINDSNISLSVIID